MAKLPWRPAKDEPADFTIPEWTFDVPLDDRDGGSVAAIGSQSSDCCPGRAAFRVVLPATDSRPHPGELFLCGHHFRASRDGLERAGATVYDSLGRLVASASLVG